MRNHQLIIRVKKLSKFVSYRVATKQHLGHAFGGGDLQLDLVLVLAEVDLGRHLAALEDDGEDGLTSLVARLVRGQSEVAADEKEPLERLQCEALGSETNKSISFADVFEK